MLHFLQTVPFVQLYSSAKGCTYIGLIPGNHFVKFFSALTSHSKLYQQHHKRAFPSMLISFEEKGKIS